MGEYERLRRITIKEMIAENIGNILLKTLIFIYILILTCMMEKIVLEDEAFKGIENFIRSAFSIICFICGYKFFINEIKEELTIDYSRNNIGGFNCGMEEFMLIYTKMINEQKCFKHDFNNSIQAMNGYIENKNLNGLKEYFSEFLKEVNKINFLESLTHTVKGNPGLNGVLAQKFMVAMENGVVLRYEVEGVICNLGRILGILLDNAIEAAKECSKKNVLVNIHKEDMLIIEVKNNYDVNNGLDVSRIYEENYTTKDISTKDHGLGLWKVADIISDNKNFNLITTVNGDEFSQVLKINI